MYRSKLRQPSPLYKSLPLYASQALYDSGGGPPIPEGAVLYYAFFQANLANAQLEQVEKQNTLLFECPTDRNIEQANGTVETFAPGVAGFVRGEALVNEGEATNENMNFNIAPTDATGLLTIAGTAVLSVVNIVTEGLDAALFTADNDNGNIFEIDNSLGVTGSVVALDSSASIIGEDYSMFLTGQSVGGVCTFAFKSSPVNPVNIPASMGRVATYATADGVGNRSHVFTPAGAICYFKYNQFEQSTIENSLIEVSGMPATRAATINKTSNFIENGLWVDENRNGGVDCTFSDKSDGDWDGGINTVLSRFSWDVSGGTTEGKYFNEMTVKFIGSPITSPDGSIMVISSFINANIGGYTLIRGNIESFKFMAGLKLDFTQSDYFTGDLVNDTIAVRTLRTNAGDNGAELDALGVPALIPANDIRRGYGDATHKLTLADLTPNAILWTDPNGNGELRLDGAGANLVAAIGANVSTIAISTVADVENAYWEYSGGLLYAEANGVKSTGVASAAPTIGNNTMLGSDGLGGGYPAGTMLIPDYLAQEVTP